MSFRERPILVTGAHRSGSTFVGRALALPKSVCYVHEPFNVDYGLVDISRWFLYMNDRGARADEYRTLIEKLLSGKAKYRRFSWIERDISLKNRVGRLIFGSGAGFDYQSARFSRTISRLLLKDPIACFSSEYLHREFEAMVVVLIRHPAAFAASLKTLGWRFDFGEFFQQRELMDEHLAEYFEDVKTDELTVAGEAAILWNCIYGVLTKYLERNPAMIKVRHEDLCLNPQIEFRKLYQRIGLYYDEKIESQICDLTNGNGRAQSDSRTASVKKSSRDIVHRWKQELTQKEVEIIKTITKPLAAEYYGSDSWITVGNS